MTSVSCVKLALTQGKEKKNKNNKFCRERVQIRAVTQRRSEYPARHAPNVRALPRARQGRYHFNPILRLGLSAVRLEDKSVSVAAPGEAGANGPCEKKKKKKSRLREKELHHLRECVRRAIGVTRHLSRHVSRDAGVSIQRFGRRGDSGDDKVAVKASP